MTDDQSMMSVVTANASVVIKMPAIDSANPAKGETMAAKVLEN